MKDTNKTMDKLLDTCKLFAATILVAVLLLTFAGCEKGRVNDAPTQTIPTTQQTTQPETTQAPTIKETHPGSRDRTDGRDDGQHGGSVENRV